ncbi:MAG: MFS transporter [Desulfarculales bacterium]|nr:MFS transporter [Desulfarculales bacterium]
MNRFNLVLLTALVLGHIAVDLNQGALPAILPILKERMNLSYAESASILMTMTFFSSIIQPVFGYMSDRWDLSWILPVGVLIAGIFFALLAFVSSYSMTLLLVFISGLGVAAYHPQGAKEALLCSPRRVISMSWFMVGGNFGNGLGPIAIMGCYAVMGDQGTLLFALPALAVALILIRAMRNTEQHDMMAQALHVTPRPIGKRFRPMFLLLLAVMFRASMQTGLMIFLPFYAMQNLGADTVTAAALLTFYLVVGSAGTLAGGHIAQRIGPRRFFLISVVLVTPASAFFLLTEGGFFFYLWLGLTGATLMATWSSMLVMAQDILPDRSGMAAALMVGVSIGSGGVGATLLGFVADIWGVMLVMTIMVTFPLFSGAIAWFSRPVTEYDQPAPTA